MMETFIELWEMDFLKYALLSTLFLSVLFGLLSPLVVARRYAFLGSAVSHSTLLGLAIAMAFFPIDSKAIFPITLLITLALAMLLGFLSFKKKVPADSMIGIFYTSTMGLGIIIHALKHKGSGDLMALLFGNILLLEKSDVLFSLFLLFIGTLIILIPFKRWQFVGADPEGAELAGLNIKFYHYVFLALLTILIVASVKIAGPIVSNSWVIAPGIFGLRFAGELKKTYLYSILYSVITSVGGLIFANHFDLPPGATLCVVQFVGLLGLLIRKK